MKNEEAEVAELFGAVEVAMKPGLKKVEAFAIEYNAGNCTSEMGRKPVCTELSRYARSKEDWPVGTAIMPKWLRLAVGKLKLIPVGAYLGECGLHAGNGLFFVCPRIKKTARKKGARK